MAEEDKLNYLKLGLKSGLEIHQQLDSKKLFCQCPSLLRNDKADFIIKRRLHAIAGESGGVDIAAAYQSGLNQEFIYEGYNENTCLVELDEEPPHSLNQEALKIALQISLLLNCQPLKYTQVMRKTVINGSNTSGFQRTMLIAKNGFIETSFGKVNIDYVFLEEDSARPVSSKEEDDPELEHSRSYKLDRLGIPLVEIATGPHMHTPEQIREAALKIGEIIRACKVRRGIGTIRQDLNISISGSERVEIKGFQDPRTMIQTVNNEIERQIECVKNKNCKKEVRRANLDGSTKFLRPMPGSARMYPETDLPLLNISKHLVDEAKRTLPKLRTELKEELRLKGLNEELIKLVLEDNKVEDFKDLMIVYRNPNLIAKLLSLYPRELSVKNGLNIEFVEEKLNKDVLVFILEALNKKKINESQIREVLDRVLSGKLISDAIIFEKQDLGEIETKVMKLIKEKPGLNVNAYMGLLMQEFKGKVDGKTLIGLIQKYIKN